MQTYVFYNMVGQVVSTVQAENIQAAMQPLIDGGGRLVLPVFEEHANVMDKAGRAYTVRQDAITRQILSGAVQDPGAGEWFGLKYTDQYSTVTIPIRGQRTDMADVQRRAHIILRHTRWDPQALTLLKVLVYKTPINLSPGVALYETA